jgi:hypothetical protein
VQLDPMCSGPQDKVVLETILQKLGTFLLGTSDPNGLADVANPKRQASENS